jgi:hypothetical protein
VRTATTNINIAYSRNKIGGIEYITITDDGHGIPYERIEKTFGSLGDSHKKYEVKSPGGRIYHGKTGQGRYKGFVLGGKITWKTSYKDDHGEAFTYSISSMSENKIRVEVSDREPTGNQNTGTMVVIEYVHDEKVFQLGDSYTVSEKIGMKMAPYLFAYEGININVEGFKVDPTKLILNTHDIQFTDVLTGDTENVEIIGLVKIIEWRSGNHKRMFLCNQRGVTYDEMPISLKYSGFSHCVYVMSDIVEQLCVNNELPLKEINPVYGLLIENVNNIIRNFYRKKISESAAKTVQLLKEQKVYPYQGQPENKVEEAERQVFDICAVKIHQYLPDFTKNSKASQKFTLQLLKQAIVQNPSSIRKILEEVIDLTHEQQNELAELLEKTTLPNIINTTKVITDRLTFINALELILFDNDYQKRLKERSQLHKILLKELWIFGEQYELGGDDISLKNVLKSHIKLLKRNNLIEEIDIDRINSLDDIPDLCLWRQYCFGQPGEYENLVVELKRPSCIISEEEINQIEKYAYAIEDEKLFDKEKTKWTFVLVGTKLSNYAKKRCSQADRDFGHIIVQDNINAYVREWRQVIQEAKGRLHFLKQKLEFSIEDNSEGLEYLAQKYKELLPY